MCAQFIWMKLSTLKGCHLLNKPAGYHWGRLTSALYRVAYTPHLSGDTTTSNSRSMSGVFARWTIFLMKGIRDVFQTVFNNQQLLSVLIMLVLEKKLLLHQLLHFVNGSGLRLRVCMELRLWAHWCSVYDYRKKKKLRERGQETQHFLFSVVSDLAIFLSWRSIWIILCNEHL